MKVIINDIDMLYTAFEEQNRKVIWLQDHKMIDMVLEAMLGSSIELTEYIKAIVEQRKEEKHESRKALLLQQDN